jgi:prepilin-type N-terminal cleavage/methylation domain-containing protein
MHRMTRRRRPGDEGFTLIEMIVTISIMGVISAALFGVVLSYFQASASTRTRLSESTDQQFVSAYWQQDVSALGRRALSGATITTSQSVWVGTAAPGGCGSSVPGSVVVSFAWREFLPGTDPDTAWDATVQEAAYVATGSVLKRVRCRAGVADAPHTVAHNIVGTPTVTCLDHDDAVSDTSTAGKCADAALPARVSLTMNVADTDAASTTGYTTTLTADRRQG